MTPEPMKKEPDSFQAFLDEIKAALEVQAQWAAEMERMEDQIKVIFSRKAKEAIDAGSAVAKAEHEARASPVYSDALDAMAETRAASKKASANAEYYRLRFEAWRTRMSTARANMQANQGKGAA